MKYISVETTPEAQAKRKLQIPLTQATSGLHFFQYSVFPAFPVFCTFPLHDFLIFFIFSSSGGGFKKLMAKAKTIPVPRITGLAQVRMS